MADQKPTTSSSTATDQKPPQKPPVAPVNQVTTRTDRTPSTRPIAPENRDLTLSFDTGKKPTTLVPAPDSAKPKKEK